MAEEPVVFALANPDPEVDPAEAGQYAAVVASGRSDYPNQINNVLAFPGVFRGLLDARAREVTTDDAAAAAEAIAHVRHRRGAQRQLHHPERLRPERAQGRGPGDPRGRRRAALSPGRARFADVSFVPLQGRATLVPQHPPRLSEVEFSGPARTVRMPMRGAIPVLTRAIRVDDAHPSVGLLSGATLLAMKLVAAGRIRVSETGDSWRAGPLRPEDDDRLRALATSRAYAETTVDEAEDVVRQLLDAVVDTVTRPPAASPPDAPRRTWLDRLGDGDDGTDDDLPDRVRLALRVEAPEEVLAGGGVIVVPQAHEVEDDDTHFADAEALWHGAGHGFSPRARLALSVALRTAATAWEPLDRLLHQPVPDRMVLDADELTDLLEPRAPGALRRRRRRVLAARAAGRAGPAGAGRGHPATVRGPAHGRGCSGPDRLFSFDWRLALGDDPLTEAEMATLTGATSPVIRLRDNWMVIDPAVARRARSG